MTPKCGGTRPSYPNSFCSTSPEQNHAWYVLNLSICLTSLYISGWTFLKVFISENVREGTI